MRRDKLERLNDLDRKIHDLDCFNHVMKCSSEGTLTGKFLSVWGSIVGKDTIFLDKEMIRRILPVLEQYKEDLTKEFEEIK